MAEILPIQGGPETAKVRNVVAVALLPYITFFIYLCVWWYKINRELADFGRKQGRQDLGTSPGTSLLAVTLGAFLLIPVILSVIGTYKRVKLAQQIVGIPAEQQINGAIFGLLYFFIAPVGFGYLQAELNKVWQLQAGRPLGGVPQPGSPTFTQA